MIEEASTIEKAFEKFMKMLELDNELYVKASINEGEAMVRLFANKQLATKIKYPTPQNIVEIVDEVMNLIAQSTEKHLRMDIENLRDFVDFAEQRTNKAPRYAKINIKAETVQ